MGRITIFSADGCPHSRRCTAALKSRGIPFVSISITQYPKKRQDMIALSNRLSTPQVFFNTRHVGGASETIALLEQWDRDAVSQNKKRGTAASSAYDRYQAEIAQQFDPSNPRFDIPDYEPVRVEAGPPRGPEEYSIQLPWNKERATVLEMTETLKHILPDPEQNKIRQGLLTWKRRVFTGEQLVEAVVDTYQGVSPCEAKQLGQHLLEEQVILPASSTTNQCDATTSDSENKSEANKKGAATATASGALQFKACSNALYRLQCYAEPSVLNSYRIWKEELPKDVPFEQLLYHLSNLMSQIFSSITDDMGTIDYVAGRAHHLYPIFEEAVCALQKVDLGLMNDSEKTAFGINLYNLMIKYAFIKVGAGDSDYSRLIFFNRVSFNVGGHVYNFQDWENGILRGNRKAPYALSLQFHKKDDPRLQYVVQKPESRMHFGLNCGAQSCPPVNYYTSENLEMELRLAAAAFCEDDSNLEVVVDPNKSHGNAEIRISKIFSWYKADFVESVKQYPGALVPYLRGVKKQQLERVVDSEHGKKVKVSFVPYDWSTGAKRIATFDANALKDKERNVKSVFSYSSPPSSPMRKKKVAARKPSTGFGGMHAGEDGTECSSSSSGAGRLAATHSPPSRQAV